MIFKSSSQLIGRVAKELSSYEASGTLDTGDFYRWIKEVLGKLNISSYSPAHAIIPLNGNSKVRVPDDLYQLWTVWKYQDTSVKTDDVLHYQGQQKWMLFENKCEEKVSDCPLIYKESENIITTKRYIQESGDTYTVKYKNEGPIKIVNYVLDNCVADSPSIGVNSPMQASMDNNYFYFNFSEGSIYLQYYRIMMDEKGLPMIPDVVEIEQAIENYILYRMFRQLYYDTQLDVIQRMKNAEAEYLVSYGVAESWVKLPTFASIIRLANSNKGRYKMFELSHARD